MQTSDDPVIARAKNLVREMSPEQRGKMLHALKESTCPDCGSLLDFRQMNGEVVCMGCGMVRSDSRSLQYLSTNDYSETSSPVTNLAFGRGLGGTLGSRRGLLGKKDLFRVLAKAPAGKEDIGLRARWMRVMATQNEHPTIHKLVEMGSALCEEFGMTGEDAVFFADHLGKLLRKVGSSACNIKTPGESVRAKRLAVATFVYMWQLMERDRGQRREIEYEEYFPGARVLFKKFEPNKYKVDKQAWDFVSFEVTARALWRAHQPLKSEGELMADVARTRPDDGTVQSSRFLVDGHEVSEGTTCKKSAPKPKYHPGTGEIPWENLTEHQRDLLRVFYEVDEEETGDIPVRKSTVKMHVCSSVATLRRGTLATVLGAISRLEQSARSQEVALEDVRVIVDGLDFPGKSAKKQRQKAYDMYAFLVSVLEIKAGLTPDLFIGSVILRRLLEVYKDPARLSAMPWPTPRPYRIVTDILKQLPLTLKSP